MSVRAIHDSASGRYGPTDGVFDPAAGRRSRIAEALLAGSRDEEQALRRGLWERQFSVHYQPVVEIATGRLVGAEALARWRRNGELLPAERFMRLAERSGVVLRLGARVFRSVAGFHASAGLSAQGGLRIAVNISESELLHPRLGDTILDALQANSLGPDAIELEVSERVLGQGDSATTAALQRLWEQGFACTLDDLGSSAASASHLRSLPFLAAKVDLPAALRTEETLAAHMRTIDLAQSLGITVIAKRVSGYDHLELLSWLGLGRAQGFAFGAPASATVFRGLLADAGFSADTRQRPGSSNGRHAEPALTRGKNGFAEPAPEPPARTRTTR